MSHHAAHGDAGDSHGEFDRDDPVIEAGLEELLGGAVPPDLTQRIVAALQMERGGADVAARNGSAPASIAPASVPASTAPQPLAPSLPTEIVSLSATNARALRIRRRRQRWQAALAASVVLVLGGYAATRVPWNDMLYVAEVPRNEATDRPGNRRASQRPAKRTHPPGQPADVAASPSTRTDWPDPAQTAQQALVSATPADETAEDLSAARSTVSSSNDADVVASIDELIRRRWEESDVAPSPEAADWEWCRRVYLDVLGRIPSAEETNTYVRAPARARRPELLTRLLDSDEYVEEYARNWTNVWTNLLVGRNGGLEQNSIISRDGLQQYLRRSFLRNKPYDQMVEELVGADGSSTPGTQGFNGAVNFVLHNLDENAAPATAKTARIFLGMQVQCTQCHNHPFNESKQNQFWELNAFFRQTRPVPTQNQGIQTVLLTDGDFAGEAAAQSTPGVAAIFYEERNGELSMAVPHFIDGTKIDPSGAVATVNRRDELARLIAGSREMPRAIVNRLWSHFLGYGFTKPVDDMGPHNPPSHPELLDRLAADFAGQGYDLKQLIRWIALSEAYSLSSRITPRNAQDNPETGERPLFSHFYLRQMRAEELYNSLIVATGAEGAGGGDFAALERRKAEWLSQFTIAFGTDENDETTSFNGTIPQVLMMWNGDLINTATSGQAGTLLYNVAASDGKNAAKINHLFTTALSRKPTKREVDLANQMWASHQGDSLAALQDVWWVVLNSNEFIFNH